MKGGGFDTTLSHVGVRAILMRQPLGRRQLADNTNFGNRGMPLENPHLGHTILKYVLD